MADRSALVDAVRASAARLGIDPVDLLTTMSFETGGSLDPNLWGGKNKNHLGLIQFGTEERAKYGVRPGMSAPDQVLASENYLRDRGLRPGMGLLDIYSTVNAGRPGLYNRSDTANGGTPGTVRDKVEFQMAGHKARAQALLGGGGGMLPASPAAPAPGTAPMSLAPEVATAGLGGGGLDATMLAALQGIAGAAEEKPQARRINPEAIHYAAAPGLARGRAKALSQIMQGMKGVG